MHGVLLRITNAHKTLSMILSWGINAVPVVICKSHLLRILTDITNMTNLDSSQSDMYLRSRVSGSEPSAAIDEARLTAGIW